MKRSITAVAGFALWLAPAIAASQDAPASEAPPETSGGLGLTAGLEYGFFSASAFVDGDGERQDLPEGASVTAQYINLHGEYAIGPVPGLYAGVDIPVVLNSATRETGAGSLDVSGNGLGDLSLFVGYQLPAIPELLEVGGNARLKLPTGVAPGGLAADEAPTGDGSTHIQLTAEADATFEPGLTAHADLGYILTLGFTSGGAEVNPGDVFFFNAGVGYVIEDLIEPVLVLNYATAGNEESGPEGGELAERPNSAASFLTLGLDVYVEINPMLRAKVGWGTSQIASGLVLDRGGLLLSGENVVDGVANFNLGLSARF